MIAAAPNINDRLNILLPKTFPKAIPLLPFREALMLTATSGADVPKATTVKPIKSADTLSLFAMPAAPSTK